MRHICLAAIALISSAAPLAAQAGVAQPGATVRATLGTGDPLIGTLISRTADSLTMALRGRDALVKVANSSIGSLEVMNGKRRIAPAAKWAIVGGGLWALVTLALPYDDCQTRPTQYCSNSRGEFVGLQAAGMAMITGAIGAVRGEERWVRIEGSAPTTFIAPSPRGAAVGVRFSL